jgi:O-antigen ligase
VRKEDRLLFLASCCVFTLAFVSGGSSQESNLGTTVAQLLAIPVLLLALWEASARRVFQSIPWTLAIFTFIVLLPALELLPLPGSIWSWPAARQALQQDLSMVGVENTQYHWTLSPAATERDLLLLLPAAALFLAAASLRSAAQWRLFWLVIVLSLLSCILGFAQVGGGRESMLNLFPQWEPAYGGFFANPHHQADATGISLVLSIALILELRSRLKHGEVVPVLNWLLVLVAPIFVLMIPLLGSRAAPIITFVPVVLLVLGSGAISSERLRTHRGAQVLGLICIPALVLAVHAAFVWTTGEKVDTIRSALTTQTSLIGVTHAPLGGGLGTFVPLFEQGVDTSLLREEYINSAHNDYVQLWLEGGILAALAILAVLVWWVLQFLHCIVSRPARSGSRRRRGLAASLAMLVIILHSVVDYPLRTPALLALFALMAGVLAGTRVRRQHEEV